MDNKLESDEKRRYAKALLQNEKLKAKYQFEKEVSKELAARNDHLKKEYGAECDKSKFLIGSLDEVTAKFELLFESVGSGKDQFSKDQSEAIAKHCKEIQEQLEQLKAKCHPADTAVKRRKSIQDSEANATTCGGGAETESTLTADSIPDGGAEPQLSHMTVKKSRRRASSVYILEGTGTSLTRHKNSLEAGAAAAVPGAGGAINQRSSISALFNNSPDGSPVSAAAPESESEEGFTASVSRRPFQMFAPVEEEQDPSTEAPAADAALPAATEAGATGAAAGKAAPLFEHFLVVGIPQDAADEFAEHIRVFNDSTLSNTLRKKFGGLFRSKSEMGASMLSSGSAVPSATSLKEETSIASVSAASSTFGSARNFFSRWGSDATPAATLEEPAAASTDRDPVVAAFRAGSTVKPKEVDADDTSASAAAESLAEEAPSTPKVRTQSQSAEDAPLTLKKHNVNDGTAASEATILFRYPPDVDPPPQEICDFCLPLGGKLKRILKKEEDTVIQEILYGHSQSKRSPRCFIFTLEDKTINNEADGAAHSEVNDEIGLNTGKLFGICVIHPRLLKGRAKAPADGAEGSAPGGNSVLVAEQMEFEAQVCYAFVTRYPLFDFFFQVIWDLITTERLHRMEAVAMHMAEEQDPEAEGADGQGQAVTAHYDRDIYQYLPTMQYSDILGRLSRLPAPRYASSILFQACKSMGAGSVNKWLREVPPIDIAESIVNASNWALPTLLSWIPVELLVWVISLLMCEAKIIVVGTEPGLVSCGVMGLLSLLRPLSWVAPIIPVLPLKHLDFIESPVPIIAGLVLDPTDTTMTSVSILESCSDDELMSVVFDVSNRGVLVSPRNLHQLRDFVLPGAEMLLDKLRECVEKGFGTVTSAASVVTNMAPGSPIRSGISINNQPSALKMLVGQQRTRPLYDVSAAQKRVAVDVQEYVLGHLVNVIAKTGEYNTSLEQLKWNRVNGVAVDGLEEESLLFAEGARSPVPSKINYRSDNIGVSAGWGAPKVSAAAADAEGSATDDSTVASTSTITATSTALRRLSQLQAPDPSSFHNFASEENSQLPFVNLLTQPLIGSDMAFYQKFSASQIYSEYTAFSAVGGLQE